MSQRLFTPEDQDEVLRLLEAGHSYREIAAQTGWSLAKVCICANANKHPGLRLTQQQRAKLGSAVVKWAEDNKVEVLQMRARMLGAWSRPPTDTAILLALAERVQAELVEQTGGGHSTMRAALYRMMGVYGAAKKLYGSLGSATATALQGRGARP